MTLIRFLRATTNLQTTVHRHIRHDSDSDLLAGSGRITRSPRVLATVNPSALLWVEHDSDDDDEETMMMALDDTYDDDE